MPTWTALGGLSYELGAAAIFDTLFLFSIPGVYRRASQLPNGGVQRSVRFRESESGSLFTRRNG